MINKAMEIAIKAHADKNRKGTEIPYVIHPLEVGMILARNKMSDDVIISGILHDVVEDGKLTLNDVEEMFGPVVKRIVEKVYTADKDVTSENWRIRRKHTLDYLREEASPEFKFVSCADKLSNIKLIADEMEKVGHKVWDRYEEGYENKKWYHQSLVVSLSQISNYRMYKEYIKYVKAVFGRIEPHIYITHDLDSVTEKVDEHTAIKSSWLKEPIINFLANVINHYKILDDVLIEEDIRQIMSLIILCNIQINRNENLELSDEEWYNIIKIFYMMKYFFKYHNKWIEKHLGVNYMAWFKIYDKEFVLNM